MRARFRLLVVLAFLRVLGCLTLVFSLVFALSTLWFRRRGTPGKGSVVQLEGVFKLDILDLFIG